MNNTLKKILIPTGIALAGVGIGAAALTVALTQEKVKIIKGEQGRRGYNGVDGHDGIQGLAGRDGRDGIQGLQGPAGRDGIQGPQGDPGQSGLQGIQGERGEQGIQGERGPQGIQGIQGERGARGEAGITTIVNSNSALSLNPLLLTKERLGLLWNIIPNFNNFWLNNSQYITGTDKGDKAAELIKNGPSEYTFDWKKENVKNFFWNGGTVSPIGLREASNMNHDFLMEHLTPFGLAPLEVPTYSPQYAMNVWRFSEQQKVISNILHAKHFYISMVDYYGGFDKIPMLEVFKRVHGNKYVERLTGCSEPDIYNVKINTWQNRHSFLKFSYTGTGTNVEVMYSIPTEE